MSNKDILEKAIQKAIDGGWLPALRATRADIEFQKIPDDPKEWMLNQDWSRYVFNHDFAKALWGEPRSLTGEELTKSGFSKSASGIQTIGWQHHLQQMVIAEDPIKYLGDNI